MKNRSLYIWNGIHKWTSLICTLFLFVLCITGLPLIFREEIEQFFYIPPFEEVATEASAPTVDEIIASAKAERLNDVVQFVFLEEEFPIISVAMAATEATPFEEGHIQPFDSRTGEMITPLPTNKGFLFWMEEAHIRFFMGFPGTLFLGVMGILFLVSIVSGVVVYAPFMRNLRFATVRKTHNPRIKWLDLHNMTGIVTATWLFVVGATGVLNTLDIPIAGLWQATELKEMVAEFEGAPLAVNLSSIDNAIAKAKEISPGMRPYSIAFPGNNFSSPQHYGIYMVGNTGLTKHLIKPVLIEAETGEFTATRDVPVLVKALFLSRPLHFGDYAGLPLKLIWALLDIVAILVLGSGVYLWLKRRKLNINKSDLFRNNSHEKQTN
ncbi:PepSY domain-containing protein [Alteromonas sp. 5E99-2]|uniref:PepSY-associated TM helix domain-containing protein n=1 Tax=Alteromonas sp. 5E99-2 TaxID=2817683 RepID=UPI001A9981D3|nr:PepSY domain-containing protein [Alteromonas sp. 5E99-2]MBO1256271.1 PepSY domain-containing protein [Alteromonas sp. 5E99-2]